MKGIRIFAGLVALVAVAVTATILALEFKAQPPEVTEEISFERLAASNSSPSPSLKFYSKTTEGTDDKSSKFYSKPTEGTGDKSSERSPASNNSAGHSEGIQVHGHWTIEVREPDGALVSRQEIDNDLQAGGAKRLSMVLGRRSSVGKWWITMSDIGVTARGACLLPDGSPVSCTIIEGPDLGVAPSAFFPNLTVQVPESGPNQDKLVLSGTVTAARDGYITRVQSNFRTCPASVAPADCPASLEVDVEEGSVFSTTDFNDVRVRTGQQILTTGVFSFS